jgi:hypothetical protein
MFSIVDYQPSLPLARVKKKGIDGQTKQQTHCRTPVELKPVKKEILKTRV